MAKQDSELLVPLRKTVTIGREELEVRPFSVKDIIHFTRDLVEGLSAIKAKYPSLEFKNEDMLQYFPLLLDEAPRLINLMALAIDKDGEWLQAQNMSAFSALFLAIAELNDFGTIISNFKAGWSNLKKQVVA